jgi:hypothetical protein
MSYHLLREGTAKPRKPHRCEWCAERVTPKVPTPYRTYVFEGCIQTAYMHPECREAMDDEDPYNLMEGWSPGDYKRGTIDPR